MPGLLIRSSNHLWKPQYNLSTYSNILADPRNILISRAGRAEFRFKNKCEILTSGPRTYIQKARVPVVSANYFEFSTKRLENAKTTKFALFAGLILPFLPDYVKSLLKSYIKNSQTNNILNTNYLLPQHYCDVDWKTGSANFFAFWMYLYGRAGAAAENVFCAEEKLLIAT